MSSRVKQAADAIRQAVRELSPAELMLLKEELERDLPLNTLVGIQEPWNQPGKPDKEEA